MKDIRYKIGDMGIVYRKENVSLSLPKVVRMDHFDKLNVTLVFSLEEYKIYNQALIREVKKKSLLPFNLFAFLLLTFLTSCQTPTEEATAEVTVQDENLKTITAAQYKNMGLEIGDIQSVELAETIAQHDPEHFPLQEFYVFGWSGKLRQQEREKAAQALHEEIIAIQSNYEKKYGKKPVIRIIAHSHGGNVALSMAKIKDAQHPLIKSLILLACPVQERTKHLICTPMFHHVYSLYSSFDLVQIIAPQFRRLCTKYECPDKQHKYHYKIMPFSNRVFPTYSHLTQTKVKINDLPISHTKFSSKKFAALLPTILRKLDSWHEESLMNNTISKHKLLCVYNK